MTQKVEPSEDLIRHIILNSLRVYNKKFRDKYGSMVICMEGKGNWRLRDYPQYKHKRRANRGTDGRDWSEIFRILNVVKAEIIENMPWYVMEVNDTEADDVIAQIALTTQEFGQHEDVMIVSSDKDFLQLQEGTTNIQQFCPRFSKLLKQDSKFDLHAHICKGDSTDGIPNIMSGDDVFVDGERQTTMYAKKIEEFRDNEKMSDYIKLNYARNKKLIDLNQIPEDVKVMIDGAWNNKTKGNTMKTLGFLVKSRCRNLIECVGDFNNSN